MPAPIQENNTNNEKPAQNEQMWDVLKSHIIRERIRRKQEREAEVEEERLRKEREEREKQDVMTLGETKEQLSQLEARLAQLKEEKHQLFLQLKKVLNEDDNRRRQLIKESSDMLALQAGLIHQHPLYISQSMPRTGPVSQPQTGFKGTIKRPRSPSPPPAVPVSLYHQGYGYKPTPVTAYQTSQQKDDGRRHELVRAVLWNKTPQYTSQPYNIYQVPPEQLPMYYPQPQAPVVSREQPRPVYETPRPQPYHIETKLPDHFSLRPTSSHAHVIHGGTLTITSQPPQKSGSITSGYPVRSQTQYQQVPTAAPALYTAQSRPLYQSPGAPGD